jgi:hypothetical protein
MARIQSCLVLLSAVVFGTSLCAQSDQTTPPSQVREVPAPLAIDQANGHVKTLPAPGFTPPSLPFAIDGQKRDAENSVRILPAEEMSREDQDLLANSESSIRERAGIENMEFEGAGWGHYELACPALPKHLFVRFTRDDGTRQMSMFSAAIPRDGNGKLHIIPIVRKGYSLFSPAPIGKMTVAAFNRIRTEEGAGASADWLGTGLCYAALAGATPQVGRPVPDANDERAGMMEPTLTITTDGGAVIRFADVSSAAKPMQWSMIFDPKGKLVKAMHGPAYIERFSKTTVQ